MGLSRRRYRHLVFDRQNEDCYHCGGTVERIEVSGRRIYVCYACQPSARAAMIRPSHENETCPAHLGNQLFPLAHVQAAEVDCVFMIEHRFLCPALRLSSAKARPGTGSHALLRRVPTGGRSRGCISFA